MGINPAMDQAIADTKKQFLEIGVTVFAIVWVCVRNRFNPWNAIQKFVLDLVDGILGIRNG